MKVCIVECYNKHSVIIASVVANPWPVLLCFCPTSGCCLFVFVSRSHHVAQVGPDLTSHPPSAGITAKCTTLSYTCLYPPLRSQPYFNP